jgi:ABC-type Fe3+/spermidine/putrescine transport system ATPase subunit
MIRFHKVGKSFGDAVALRPADLTIAADKTTVLLGLSGSGKSTILRLISGLLEPTTGWIEVDGKKLTRDSLPELRRQMGYVIQSGDLFPHLTARRNILLAAQEIQMRQCMTCGHVGCCDSSPGKHATRHFHETKHPVMRSVMPGERWTWCYVHEVAGELVPATIKKESRHHGQV